MKLKKNIVFLIASLIMVLLVSTSGALPVRVFSQSSNFSHQAKQLLKSSPENITTPTPTKNITISPPLDPKLPKLIQEHLKEMDRPQAIPKGLDRPSKYLGPQGEIEIKNYTINNIAKTDPPADFHIFVQSGQRTDSGVREYANSQDNTCPWIVGSATPPPSCKWTEPAAASNGRAVFFTGNHFAARSENAGMNFRDTDYNAGNFVHNLIGGPDNTGDNDVIYSSRIHKFIWYRQGTDGRFSLGTSSDGLTWNFIPPIEANNFRDSSDRAACQPPLTVPEQDWNPIPCNELNLNTILAHNHLTRPSDCTAQDWEHVTVACSVNFWWDYPQLALSDGYLYISTDVMLGCGKEGLDWAYSHDLRCEPGNSLAYGSVILRANLTDLNRIGVVNQQYFKRSENNYYNSAESNLGLAQGAGNKMYWASHVAPEWVYHRLRICSWDDSEPAAHCVAGPGQDIPPYRVGGDMICPGNDNRNWCSFSGSNHITGGWVYNGQVGFLWNVGKDPGTHPGQSGVYPYPWVDAAAFNINEGLRYINSPALANPWRAIQYAFASVNQRGLSAMAWVGGPEEQPGLLVAIKDNFSVLEDCPAARMMPMFSCWETHRLPYSVQPATQSLPPSNVRWGDYLRLRPFAGSGHLWEGSAYVLSGDITNPSVKSLYIIFGRQGDSNEYNIAPDCSTARPNQVTLWPPNHQMTSITIMGVRDPNGDPVTINIINIHQDEPTRANPGDQSPDGAGIGTTTAQVRAERTGLGDGRVYHISFTANDGIGGTCNGEVIVSVPHDQQHRAVDSGAIFDSIRP